MRRPKDCRMLGVCLGSALVFLVLSASGRGQADKPPVHLTFINQSGGPVNVFWAGAQGEQPFGRMENGNTLDVNTYIGHVWVIRDANNKEVKRFSAQATGEVSTTIDPPAGSPPKAAPITTGSAITPQERA